MSNVNYSKYSRNCMYFLFKLLLCHCHRDMNLRIIQLGHEVVPFVLTLCFSDCLRFNINFPIIYSNNHYANLYYYIFIPPSMLCVNIKLNISLKIYQFIGKYKLFSQLKLSNFKNVSLIKKLEISRQRYVPNSNNY